MGTYFFLCVGQLLELHLKEAAVSKELDDCMDDITLDYVPSSWPLVTQVYVVVALFGSLYTVAKHSVSELYINPLYVDILAGLSRGATTPRSFALQTDSVHQAPVGERARTRYCIVPTGDLHNGLQGYRREHQPS